MSIGEKKFTGKTFFYFTPTHYLRKGAITLVADPWYDRIIVVLIFAHSISVMYQEPGGTGIQDRSFLDSEGLVTIVLIVDRLLLVFFAVECGVSLLAYNERRVLRSPFKMLDVIVVVIGVIGDFLTPERGQQVSNEATATTLRVLLALNALRPLRAIQRVSGMRKLMMVIVSCLPTMASVVVLALVLLFFFSMAGVILFSSSLHARCLMHATSTPTDPDWANVCTSGSGNMTDS